MSRFSRGWLPGSVAVCPPATLKVGAGVMIQEPSEQTDSLSHSLSRLVVSAVHVDREVEALSRE